MEYVLVTGAYGGMGNATLNALVDCGYSVIAIDKKVGESQKGVYPIQADLTDLISVQQAFKKVSEITTELKAIVHFAGIYTLDSFEEISEERLKRAFDINFFGVYRVNKTFLPLLKKGSKILITTSELAPLDPLPFTGIYAVTKATLDKYAFSLRMELQLLGISVVVLRPGAVKTTLLGDSTRELDAFCNNTKLYKCNADRFKKIVDSVEARNVAPEKIAKKVVKILKKKRPKHVYSINRNPLLLLLNVLPSKTQTAIIGKILKPKKEKLTENRKGDKE